MPQPVSIRTHLLRGLALLLVLAWFVVGINWGLPSRRADPFLFGADREPWSGSQIMELAPFGELDSNRGADVDVNPIANREGPVVLNETDRQRAEIVRRYRLFTYQPDEWNTMRSLAGMRPGELKLDPRLYQYGGLWVYGVGAMLKVASIAGLVDLKGGAGGLTYYLDHPEAFGRFYVVARLYSALWGVVGAWAVYRLALRLMPAAGAASAAACYALMPVVVNQAHEAKPHLAGLALMLLAVLAACRYVETGTKRWSLVAGAACGAAFGMVISSLVVFVVLPLMTLLRRETWANRARVVAGACAAVAVVYILTNPYVPYNLLFNREVLRSNLGASMAMYEVSGTKNGLVNGVRLVAEGMSPVLAVAGLIGAAMLAVWTRKQPDGAKAIATRHVGVLLGVPALIVAAQFVALGAGKPGEYGRFALLPDTALCIAGVAGAYQVGKRAARRVTLAVLLVTTGFFGATYVARFIADSRPRTSRLALAKDLLEVSRFGLRNVQVTAEPAPYCLPPVNLFDQRIELLPRGETTPAGSDVIFLRAVDARHGLRPPPGFNWRVREEPAFLRPFPSRISWAAKPFEILIPARDLQDVPRTVGGAPREPARTPDPP